MKQKIISLLKKETKLPEKEIENLIEIPPSKELGDYAFPCFKLGKNAKEEAEKLKTTLAEATEVANALLDKKNKEEI